MESPFSTTTNDPLVALAGQRCGYIQLATSQLAMHYADLPDEIFTAAKDWAACLEKLGAQRVYWIMLAEQVTHLHLHLYPRWTSDEIKGLPLFEQRNMRPQPDWSDSVQRALADWAERHQVHLL